MYAKELIIEAKCTCIATKCDVTIGQTQNNNLLQQNLLLQHVNVIAITYCYETPQLQRLVLLQKNYFLNIRNHLLQQLYYNDNFCCNNLVAFLVQKQSCSRNTIKRISNYLNEITIISTATQIELKRRLNKNNTTRKGIIKRTVRSLENRWTRIIFTTKEFIDDKERMEVVPCAH